MIDRATIQRVCEKLKDEQTVIEQFPDKGEMYIEKLMPYICVYRYEKKNAHFAGLLKSQASYLMVKEDLDISLLLEEISNAVSQKLNAFLIIEIWPVQNSPRATFEIFCPEDKASATVNALEEGFNKVRQIHPYTSTKVFNSSGRPPERFQPILPVDPAKESSHMSIGIAVPALYLNNDSKEHYSLFYRKFHILFSETIKRAAFEFIRVQTSNPFHHYLMLGKTHVDRVSLRADSKLAKISGSMSFLLSTTPVNSAPAWKKFKESHFQKEPAFLYRLIALDIEKAKRKLFNIRLDKVEDPTIAYILREKRLEIEKQLTMLEERGTDRFRFTGQSLYGTIEQQVIDMAKAILIKYPRPVREKEGKRLGCQEFAAYAQNEIDYYQKKFPTIKLSLEIREDVAGILVSKNKLLLSDKFALSRNRCEALIQHEIGTHILTYCNGKSQLLKQMYAGFAGYDGLQEGLAVLAEYLVDGLTVDRMRMLAGRVVATEAMVNGSGFIENFTSLKNEYNFPEKVAYNITMRIHRGGGLPKDAVYLAGLIHVMEYLESDGKLETLYTGKFNTDHIGLVEELLHRNILKSPVMPRFLERESVRNRLKKVRNGLKVIDLLD
jgi:uncharacterized protein (TIGR02421 family)